LDLVLSGAGFKGTGDSIVVRAALERDYRAISRIQCRCPETAQWPLGDYSGYPLLLALVGGEPAGFCSWRQSAVDEAEILNIAVDPGYRHRGVASFLLGAVCEQAQGAIFLEVAEPNTPAIALYRKHGWEAAGLRAGYYDHGNVNAVVMKKRSW
jgi:ribosomal protein S18 acetylase RimI-like enzyme